PARPTLTRQVPYRGRPPGFEPAWRARDGGPGGVQRRTSRFSRRRPHDRFLCFNGSRAAGAAELGRSATEGYRMQAVSREEFFQWAAGHGIGVDPRYPDSGCLIPLPPANHARFWVVPADPATCPHFVASLLGGLDEWATGLL